ncbi:MAG: LysR family transcriptional regulator [Lachnospiraceae bacterium]|nr:LysR family transcriptional regulator [Lachnospiraceae bacterium]
MNLNYFKEFVILAETRNYWEASERLFINQSTLSKHIKAMEAELGVPLFDRTTRKVTLTEFGQTLLPYARSINSIQADYTTALLQQQNHNLGLVTLGSVSPMKLYGITDLITDYQAAFSEYNIHVRENDSQYSRQMLLSQKCELAFLREPLDASGKLPPDKDSLVRIPFLTDHMLAVVEHSNPLALHETVTFADLVSEKLCFFKKNSILFNLCYSACQNAGFIPNVVYDSHYVGSIFDMVLKNGCTALLTDRQVAHRRTHNTDDALAFLPIEPGISTQISLCYPENAQLSEGAAAFVEFIKKRQR